MQKYQHDQNSATIDGVYWKKPQHMLITRLTKKKTEIVSSWSYYKIMPLQIIQIKLASHNALKCNVCKDTHKINIGLVLTEPFEKSHDICWSNW